MFYLVIHIAENGAIDIHVCKAVNVGEANALSGVSMDATKYCTITQEELNALMVVDRGVITKSL